ncbi:MAG: rhodanese-like domain-containing protein [Spirochaetes bacterium]|nr:rhodanese-like domain-containing protein [Spirochaetota bacterium]
MLKKILEKIFKVEQEELSSIIKDAASIIILSIIVGFGVNLFHPKGFSFISTSVQKSKNIIYISSEEAKIKKEGMIALFIDSRQADEFGISRIPGAINIPAVMSSISAKKMQENFENLSGPKELVIYCDGASCGSSQTLAETLIGMGYSKHIYIIKNGINEWESMGMPVERSGAEGIKNK